MKKIFLLFSTILIIGCSSNKNELSAILDIEEVLSETEELRLNKLIKEHERKTTNEIAIITTPNWGDYDNSLDFAVNSGNKLGVGKANKDNGVVIIFSKTLKETRITTGYGTERVLKDELVKQFIDSLMLPHFRKDEFYEGILAGTQAVITHLELPGNKIQ
ncbi:TPM domain-containing protein [Roseivirga pacifica]|uniref:TPM domain-containing protein n=1 Tax=Roseivirga pacifica TaxID=1267423 RepID=UPI00209449CE|nr:TPM domain-containing protein [Roseivirga pacifica]MCO6360228.1 hypothetical protein [Roseivirga pacifica]MCO6367599.1 hypothetical protein [Roseivirga pacifica]MCO6369869.1 hypothetical protein [Roseivirga pacifica]MCO6375256.1 hypothetical protein [Roseivirga pacifica]MCO6380514.1 hypothetical protein [Roseivirga pacifica]